MVKRNRTRYRIGTFNLKFGRNKEQVLKEVRTALRDYKLDALITQEAADYKFELSRLDTHGYFVCRSGNKSDGQVGILVKSGHTVDRVKYEIAGDGWWTEKGDYHGPVPMPQLRINKELTVKGVHCPTPSKWVDGVLRAPVERKDDYLEVIAAGERFLGHRSPRLLGGDWNEPPTTIGGKTPRNLANVTGSELYYPTNSKEGHGNIDYFIGKRIPQVVRVHKDTELAEFSDHNLVVITLMV